MFNGMDSISEKGLLSDSDEPLILDQESEVLEDIYLSWILISKCKCMKKWKETSKNCQMMIGKLIKINSKYKDLKKY